MIPTHGPCIWVTTFSGLIRDIPLRHLDRQGIVVIQMRGNPRPSGRGGCQQAF